MISTSTTTEGVLVSPLVLRDTLKVGGVATGLWAAIPSDFAAELMIVPGVDYVCVDQ
jgi:2-keto-3-deoxy-L-rhamnonate aldolase RhmA